MQRTTTAQIPQQSPAQKAQAPKGPTPIDPRDFKYIAGGFAPKAGW